MHFRNYERPDGWTKGQPEVLVTKHVNSTLGEPLIEYDSLHQYLTDDLGIPYDQSTTIKLFGRYLPSAQRPWPRISLVGYHAPYTKTIHANAFRAEYGSMGRRGGTMHVLAHEGRHLADTSNHRIRTAAELAGNAAAMLLGYKVAQHIPGLDSDPILGVVAGEGLWYGVGPMEKRARAEAVSPSAIAHQQDILFPHSDRTAFLARTNCLSEDTLQRLGRATIPE